MLFAAAQLTRALEDKKNELISRRGSAWDHFFVIHLFVISLWKRVSSLPKKEGQKHE
jgi:hypothetical protein